jgi:hypothetical protein
LRELPGLLAGATDAEEESHEVKNTDLTISLGCG